MNTKKVLFITDHNINKTKGGIERVTLLLAIYFRNVCGIPVYLAYNNPVQDGEPVFDDYLIWSDANSDKIREFIEKNKINIIICQQQQGRELVIHNAIQTIPYPCVLIDAFHFMPLADTIGLRDSLRRRLKNESGNFDFKTFIKWIGYPLYLSRIKRISRRKYQIAYGACDKFVLLSSRMQKEFCRVYHILDHQKFCAIPNPLTYQEFYPAEQLGHKEHIVLVVSRFDEQQKRLSLVLRIWREIEKKGCGDWKLMIVGHGQDETLYRHLAQKWNLKNVSFEGRQEPLPYYRRASLFLMTSAFEGWGMTLTEAQQMGVVPIVMDSFLPVYDIIDDEKNGSITPWCNIRVASEKVFELMVDADKRQLLARNAIEKSKSFVIQKVAAQWMSLFDELLNSKS